MSESWNKGDIVPPDPIGEKFSVSISDRQQVRLDTDYVKSFLAVLEKTGKISKADHEACYKTIEFTVVSTPYIDKNQKPVYTPPDLSNTTPSGLIDSLGQTREEMKKLKADEGVYKTRLLAEFGLTATSSEELFEYKAPEDWTPEEEAAVRSPTFYELFRAIPGRSMDEKLDFLSTAGNEEEFAAFKKAYRKRQDEL